MLRASFDANGEILSANDRFSKLTGYDATAALSIRERLTSSEEGHSILDSAASGTTYTGEMRLGELTLSGAFAPISDQDGKATGYVLLASDVTQDRAFAVQAEAQRKTAEENQAEIVNRLTNALQQLAQGDLTTRLEQQFKGGHDNLRLDFNTALTALDQTIVQVLDKAISIKGETDNISNAASDLSKRTEQQAATLEEFAAALTEITQSVASAAEGASQADEAVTAARKNAESSGEVVKQAVSAMSEIATSSEQISKIIGVIDDIAFQTNLLALNAGVEAARAGDAGRGFAVVASEVRALAQRSSEAAREINELISASGGQVKRGVSLVDKTGTALKDIVLSVREISDLVANIATSAREQSNGLSEINGAMAQLDQVTQQNAAMFEETSAATRLLSEEADNLTATTSRFATSGATALPVPDRQPHHSDWDEQEARATSTSRKAQNPSSQGALAVAVEDDEDWDEF
jgi:methyl-accepting chemotaxis protein